MMDIDHELYYIHRPMVKINHLIRRVVKGQERSIGLGSKS
jgi:hypothetical protein